MLATQCCKTKTYPCLDTYSSHNLPTVSFSILSVIPGQPQYENIQWKILEINNLYILNCTPFWVGEEISHHPAESSPGHEKQLAKMVNLMLCLFYHSFFKKEKGQSRHICGVMIDVSADPGSRAWRGVRPSAEKTGPVSPRRVAFSLSEDSGHEHHDWQLSLPAVVPSEPVALSICCRPVTLNRSSPLPWGTLSLFPVLDLLLFWLLLLFSHSVISDSLWPHGL